MQGNAITKKMLLGTAAVNDREGISVQRGWKSELRSESIGGAVRIEVVLIGRREGCRRRFGGALVVHQQNLLQ